MEKKNKPGCCSCKSDFKKEVNALVEEVDGYTKEDRKKKETEVKAAFDKKDEKKK